MKPKKKNYKSILKDSLKQNRIYRFYSWLSKLNKKEGDLCSSCHKNKAIAEIKGNQLCLSCITDHKNVRRFKGK